MEDGGGRTVYKSFLCQRPHHLMHYIMYICSYTVYMYMYMYMYVQVHDTAYTNRFGKFNLMNSREEVTMRKRTMVIT